MKDTAPRNRPPVRARRVIFRIPNMLKDRKIRNQLVEEMSQLPGVSVINSGRCPGTFGEYAGWYALLKCPPLQLVKLKERFDGEVKMGLLTIGISREKEVQREEN